VTALCAALALAALTSSCGPLTRAGQLARRVVPIGKNPAGSGRDPLYLALEIAALSDSVVNHVLHLTETALVEAADPARRARLLRFRLDFAQAMWDGASGPNPYANVVDLWVGLAVAQRRLDRPDIREALGASSPPVRDVMASGEVQVQAMARGFLAPPAFQALSDTINARDEAAATESVSSIDLRALLASSEDREAGGPLSLLGILGVDPFASLDPATREIAESRQFGERLLFSLQRLPILLRLNVAIGSHDVAQDLGVDRALASLERASRAMAQVARTTAGLPGEFSVERARLVANVRAEAERLGTLARDYRATFEAATATAGTVNQALQTFGAVTQRFQSADQSSPPSRPFDITEYARTAGQVSDAAVNLTSLLGRLEGTLDSPVVGRLLPQADALLTDAERRGREWLYTAFALGCGLIAFGCLAVIVTVAIVRRVSPRR
jgi:hypothetical protein